MRTKYKIKCRFGSTLLHSVFGPVNSCVNHSTAISPRRICTLIKLKKSAASKIVNRTSRQEQE